MSSKPIRESDLFWSAIMFYTRIPAPKGTQHSQEILNRSRKYFPLIGIIIGLTLCSVYAFAHLFFSTTLSTLLAMTAAVLATGAFHEDGFADTCDGFGGGWTTEQALTIMKDSRVGTYATVGLFFLFTIKAFTLLQIVESLRFMTFVMCVISANTISRQLSSIAIEHFDYVQDIDKSKVKPITETLLNNTDKLHSYLLTAIPLTIMMLLSFWATIISASLATTCAYLFLQYSKNRIGGYTGDVLGATQQLSEITFLLSMAALLC
jgi:adenosylcobinamide-GDP ribazoletransferase